MASDPTLQPASSMRERRDQLDTECAAIEEQMREMHVSFQEQIRAMRVAFRRQTRTVQTALAEIHRDRNLLSPAYALPDDVWFRILELAFLHPFPVCQTSHVSWTDLPTAFSHVSRRFRQIALALPSIWTNIHVCASYSETLYKMLRRHLWRSGDMPLSIWFVCHPYGVPDEESYPPDSDIPLDDSVHFTRCWKLVLPHMRRWRSLVIHGFTPMWRDGTFVKSTAVTFLEDLSSGCCSQLEHLDIYMHTPHHLPDATECSDFIIKPFEAPLIPSLRIRGLALNPSSKFGYIQRLALYNKSLSLRRAINMLRSVADTLSTLVLELKQVPGDIDEARSHPVQLPRLLCLRLGLCGLSSDHCLLIIAILPGAPNLRSLQVTGENLEWWSLPLRPYRTIIRESLVFSTVRDLRICWPQGPYGELRDGEWRYFPAVEHIILEECAEVFFDFILKHLEALDLGNPFPSLKKLSINELGNPDVLMRLIVHLNDAVHRPLEEIVLDCKLEEELDPQIVAELIKSVPTVRFGAVVKGRGNVDQNWRFDWDSLESFST